MAENTQAYVGIFNGVTTTPHGNYDLMTRVHQSAMNESPRFYMHLAAWYKLNGVVRDHNVIFAAVLISSDLEPVRNVGLALARELDPRNLLRVLHLVNKIKGGRSGRFVGVPRSLRTEVKRYLNERELDESWFDKAVVSNRSAMHDLYEAVHVSPGYYAQAILFDDTPPEGSLPWVVKQIANLDDETEKARLAIEHNLPYPILVSLLGSGLPTALLAIVSSMTPQQTLNSLKALKNAGAMDNPDLKAMIQSKIKSAGKDKRVSAGKAAVILADNVANLDEETASMVADAATESIRSRNLITKNTAICIDVSGSMALARDVARQLFAMIATAISPDAKLYMYAFDAAPYDMNVEIGRIDHFDREMSLVRGGGMTSYGAPLAAMRRNGQNDVEQIIFVGDEGENAMPTFRNEYPKLSTKPNIIVVRVGDRNTSIERACSDIGAEFRAIEFSGDKYSLQNVIPLLSGASTADLVMEILDFPLPQRKVD